MDEMTSASERRGILYMLLAMFLFTVNDAITMELRVQRPEGYEYTNNHNIIELAVFRHNIDTTFTLGRPGMVYYM